MAKCTYTKIVLCFKEGEPYLYDKENKTYIKIAITLEEALEKCKKIMIEKNYKIRPSMKEIWQLLSQTIPNCDGFCNSFSVKTSQLPENCFENFFTRKITIFLNTLFSPQLAQERHALRREYEKKFKSSNFSKTAQKFEKERQMTVKKGRKLYF